MTKTNKDPLIKISKRQNLALGYKLLLTIGAILLSLVLGGILLACLGYNPVDFYVQMILGNFKNSSYLKLMVRVLIPLLITSLGVSLAFKMRFWNIGAEGQFIVGALIAMTFSLLIGDSLPSPLGAIIIVLLGTLGGGLYALFVAVLKVKFGTNETLMTLMLNYVALYISSYTLKTDFYAVQGQGVPAFKVIAESLWLTEINIGKFSFDTALFVAVALVVIMFVYFKQSKQGYELNVVGDSPNTAKYAGMKVKWIIVRTMFLSGAIIGMAGALKLCGSSAGHTFSANITGGVGWTSIIVAWLAKLNPIGILIASLLMSILERGCAFARTSLGISESMSDVLQGIILFTVLASDFFINYKVSFRKKIKETVAINDTSSDTIAETSPTEKDETASDTVEAEKSDLLNGIAEHSSTDRSEVSETLQEKSEEIDKNSSPSKAIPSNITVPPQSETNHPAEKTVNLSASENAGNIKNKTASANKNAKTAKTTESGKTAIKKSVSKTSSSGKTSIVKTVSKSRSVKNTVKKTSSTPKNKNGKGGNKNE